MKMTPSRNLRCSKLPLKDACDAKDVAVCNVFALQLEKYLRVWVDNS